MNYEKQMMAGFELNQNPPDSNRSYHGHQKMSRQNSSKTYLNTPGASVRPSTTEASPVTKAEKKKAQSSSRQQQIFLPPQPKSQLSIQG